MLLPSSLPPGPRPQLKRMLAYSSDRSLPLSVTPQAVVSPQGIDGACDALQSVLGTMSRRNSGLRSSVHKSSRSKGMRVVKRPPPSSTTKRHNWRKRSIADRDGGSDESAEEAMRHGYGLGSRLCDGLEAERAQRRDGMTDDVVGSATAATPVRVSTPKRIRKLPPSIPFGLEHDDFLILDEALDEEMVVEGLSESTFQRRLPLDEGYGTMGSLPRLPPQRPALIDLADAPLQAQISPLSDQHDAMSVSPGTRSRPDVLSPSQALSPMQIHGPSSASPNLPIPDISLSDASPPREQQRYHFDLDPLTPGPNEAPEPALPMLPGAPLPQTGLGADAETDDIMSRSTRPVPTRLPSLAHSDPFLPTPSTPTHTTHNPFDGGGHDGGGGDAPGEPRSPSLSCPASSPSAWTDADDRALVALVVDKMRLKRSDWDACARALGADGYGASVGRRWRDLVGDGCIGLRFKYGGAMLGRSDPKDGIGGSASADGDGNVDARRLVGRRIVSGGRARRGDVRAVEWS